MDSRKHGKTKRQTPKHRHDVEVVVVDGDGSKANHETTTADDALVAKEERRRARAARKLAEHFAAMGLDENGEPLDNFSLLQYPVREWKFTLPGSREPVALNPVVTLLAVAGLWAAVLWAITDPAGAATRMVAWREALILHWTWFYQISKVITFAFVLFITYRYGHIHLGRKHDKPEYTTPTYFCMIFAASVGSSLLANGATEPLYYQGDHFYAKAGYRSQDELDMFAVNTALHHWGIGSWINVTLVAVCMALSGYRFNLPMTLRACFVPILGAYTWGWMGDAIDSLAIVAATACTCSMLGMTSIQVVAGLVYLGWVDASSTAQELSSIQGVGIWAITIVSSLSVISGLRGGIQYMPLIAMFFGSVLTFLVFAMDDSKFLMNLAVQEVGYYLQNSILQLNFWTDAFGQLREGSGRAVDGHAAESWWMGAWPLSFQAWGICLGPVVGLFVAYISRGRKLWEVVMYAFGAPLLQLVFWNSIWAGISLRHTRQALELIGLGATYFNNSEHFLADGSDLCFDVPQADVVVDGETVFTNYLPGVSPVCSFDPDDPSMTAYNVFESFSYSNSFSGHGLSTVLSLLYLLGCAFFYVAHSDAGTFIVDTLASNGRKNYHWSRRMFWAGIIAALSTALVPSTSDDSASAINAFAILCSFPTAILLCYLIQSTFLLCQAADKLKHTNDDTEYLFPDQPSFGMPVYGGVFNLVEYMVSFGKVNASRVELGMDLPSRDQLVEFGVGLVLPFLSLHKILNAVYPQNPRTNAATVACYSFCFVGWVSLALATSSYPGLAGASWTMFVVTGLLLSVTRSSFRAHYQIRSNTVADVVCATLFWPQVLAQMRLYRDVPVKDKASKAVDKGKNDDSDCENSENEA